MCNGLHPCQNINNLIANECYTGSGCKIVIYYDNAQFFFIPNKNKDFFYFIHL